MCISLLYYIYIYIYLFESTIYMCTHLIYDIYDIVSLCIFRLLFQKLFVFTPNLWERYLFPLSTMKNQTTTYRVPKEGSHRVHIVCNIRVVYAMYLVDTAIQIPRFLVHSRVPQPCHTTRCLPWVVRNNGCGNTCIIIVSDSLQKNHTLCACFKYHLFSPLPPETNQFNGCIFFIHRRRQQKKYPTPRFFFRYLWDPITLRERVYPPWN